MGQYEGGGITNGQQLLKSFPYGMTVALDFQALRVGLVRRLTSAEFVFLFMVSNPYVL